MASSGNPRLLKGLLKEIYLLIFVLLAFINFFVPAMIHSVYTPAGMKIQNRIWVQVVPAKGNQFQEALDLNAHIGLVVWDEKDNTIDGFTQGMSTELAVVWGDVGQSTPLVLSGQSQTFHVGLWLAGIPTSVLGKPATAEELTAPIQVVIYHDDKLRVLKDELAAGPLDRKKWVVVELSPKSGFQASVLIDPQNPRPEETAR